MYLDNTCLHNARRSNECLQAKEIQWIRHPAYSSDLAPSDFFLFGYIKGKLIKSNIHDQQSSKTAIAQIFDEIRQETVAAIFETWINRLREYEGEYFHQ